MPQCSLSDNAGFMQYACFSPFYTMNDADYVPILCCYQSIWEYVLRPGFQANTSQVY